MRIVIELKGGIVQEVYLDEPAEVYVLDRDLEGSAAPEWVKGQGQQEDPCINVEKVNRALNEIAQECDYCEGTGKGTSSVDGTPTQDPCEECEGKGWWFPFAVPEKPESSLELLLALTRLTKTASEVDALTQNLTLPEEVNNALGDMYQDIQLAKRAIALQEGEGG